KSLPFFKNLKKCPKKSDFQWTAEAEAAFKEMKKLIVKLPTLTAPMEKEELIVYLVAAREATMNISQRMDLDEFHSGTFRRRLSRHAHGSQGGTSRPMDADGSSCIDGFEAGLIHTNLKGTKVNFALRFKFDTTNNEAEYEALIAGLRVAEQMGVKTSKQMWNPVRVEELKEKSINEAEVLAVVEEERDTWMTLIYNYLTKETLPAVKEKATDVRRNPGRYAIINGILYKKSYLGPWLRCVGPLQANYVLREIHEGSCSMHAGTRSVVAKAIRTDTTGQ
nr:reverse transcriptase domain-containing protein [Tanacetum cinerariifolium]